jgi:hypothetical protein
MHLKTSLSVATLSFVAAFSMPTTAAAEPVILVSGMGAKCLDVEGNNIRAGTRLLGYQCNGQSNQTFDFDGDGSIRIGGLCVDAKGGSGRAGDELILWQCNGGANQRWRWSNNRLVGINGLCADLKGGDGHWFGNQPAILWQCSGASNQTWYWGKLMPATRVSGGRLVQPGQKLDLQAIPKSSLVAAGGGNMVAAGGGNMVAAGGGQHGSQQGGGNMVAAVAQLEALDLAGGRLGQFGHELDLARVLVGRQLVLDEGLELVLGGLLRRP